MIEAPPEMPMSDDPWDDTPWADPVIRSDYESALGRFVLRFNEIDNRVRRLLETVFARSNVVSLGKQVRSARFSLKIDYLEALKSDPEGFGLRDVPIAELRALGTERNFVVHAYFDQNPFDGTYDLIGDKRRGYLSQSDLDALTARADDVLYALRLAEARYDFADVPLEPPAAEGTG